MQTNTDSTTTSMPVWMLFHMLCRIQAAVVVTTIPKLSFSRWREAARAAILGWGGGRGWHILLQSNGRVFVQFTELTRCYKLPPSHPCITPYPRNIFVLSGGVLAMAASSSVREPPRHTAPITLSCHADGPLVAHARDLGKLLPAVPN